MDQHPYTGLLLSKTLSDRITCASGGIYMKINPFNPYEKASQLKESPKGKSSDKASLPKQGDSIKGEIIDLNQNSVKIKLENGQVIQAKMTENFEFNIGQKVSFTVKESGADQILLKPVSDTASMSENKLIQILENAGLSPTKENLNILMKLLENSMSVDKESIQKQIPLIKQTIAQSEADIDSVIFLIKNNITVNKENVSQLKLLIAGENRILSNLAAISDDLSKEIKNPKIDAIIQSLFDDNINAKNTLTAIKEALISATNAKDLIHTTQSGTESESAILSKEASANSLNVNTEAIPEKATVLVEDLMNKDIPDSKNNAEGKNTLLQNINTNSDLPEGATELIKVVASETDNANDNLQGATKDISNNIEIKQDNLEDAQKWISSKLSENLSPKEIELLNKEIQNILGKADNKTVSITESKSLNDIFAEIEKMDLPTEIKDKIINTIGERVGYGVLRKELFVKLDQLKSPQELNVFYEKLYSKALTLIENTSIKGEEALVNKEAFQIKNALEFMSQLNQKYNYTQLPIFLGDRLTHSELYIFNDKKKLKNEKAMVTTLLRLDMVNLGHLDIYINKQEKNLTIQFLTEDSEKNNRIENKLFEIHNVLNKLGFKVLGISASVSQKEFNIAEDFLKREDSHEIKRYTFDMRV